MFQAMQSRHLHFNDEQKTDARPAIYVKLFLPKMEMPMGSIWEESRHITLCQAQYPTGCS
jgi:hypothetical protein